jgi:hypothetical protein
MHGEVQCDLPGTRAASPRTSLIRQARFLKRKANKYIFSGPKSYRMLRATWESLCFRRTLLSFAVPQMGDGACLQGSDQKNINACFLEFRDF